jgi:hypothetical protein
MDDRAKALIAVAAATLIGISGVLAVEAVTGFQPGGAPAESTARAGVPGPSAAEPTWSLRPSAMPTLDPTAKPTPTPTAPPWKASWSKPRLVDKEFCSEFAVGIDARSRYHVVTSCDGLRYSITDADGSSTTTSLGDSKAHGPLIAFDGDQAYLAYWRVLPYEPDTCGGPDAFEPSAGVYYRRRTLPAGGWSKAIPFGKRGDHLTAFRVEDGVLHAIVWNETSGTLYVRSKQDPVVSIRRAIDADGPVSLRVGDDGRARIAYWSNTALRYGTYNGSGFSTSKIATGRTDGPAALILGPGDRPHIVYTIARPTGDGACGDPEGLARSGTYYATMVDGKWASERVTKQIGRASLALDPRTSRVHVIVGNTVYTKEPSRAWASARLPAGVEDPEMRVDPATGSLLLVYLDWNQAGESEGLLAITSR